MKRFFLKALNSDAVKNPWNRYMKVKKGIKTCLLRTMITMSPCGEEYSHYRIKRNLPTTTANPFQTSWLSVMG